MTTEPIEPAEEPEEGPLELGGATEVRLGGVFFSTIENYRGETREASDVSLTDEQKATIGARQLAWQFYNETGDESYLRDVGLIPEEDSDAG